MHASHFKVLKSIDKKGHILSSFQLIKTFDINPPIEIFEVVIPLWRSSSMHSFLYFENHHFVHRSVNFVQASWRQIQSNQNSCPQLCGMHLLSFVFPSLLALFVSIIYTCSYCIHYFIRCIDYSLSLYIYKAEEEFYRDR